MTQPFHKQSIGFNPLLSTSDWTVWGCILAGCLAACLLLGKWMPNEMVRAILIGGVLHVTAPLYFYRQIKRVQA